MPYWSKRSGLGGHNQHKDENPLPQQTDFLAFDRSHAEVGQARMNGIRGGEGEWDGVEPSSEISSSHYLINLQHWDAPVKLLLSLKGVLAAIAKHN